MEEVLTVLLVTRHFVILVGWWTYHVSLIRFSYEEEYSLANDEQTQSRHCLKGANLNAMAEAHVSVFETPRNLIPC